MQIRLQTDLTGADYVTRQVWLEATAPPCPWHGAECELAPHGTYGRRTPVGARVRRFRCRQSGRTVSLRPDCLAARLPGTLAEVEAAARAVEQAPSLKQAAEQARPGPVEPTAAERWTRRRAQLVTACLELLRSLDAARFANVEPTVAAFGTALGTAAVLVGLRAVAAQQLGALPAPLGFRPPRKKRPLRRPPRRNTRRAGIRRRIPRQWESSGTLPPPSKRKNHERTRF